MIAENNAGFLPLFESGSFAYRYFHCAKLDAQGRNYAAKSAHSFHLLLELRAMRVAVSSASAVFRRYAALAQGQT